MFRLVSGFGAFFVLFRTATSNLGQTACQSDMQTEAGVLHLVVGRYMKVPDRRSTEAVVPGVTALRNRLLGRSVTIECVEPEEPRCASSQPQRPGEIGMVKPWRPQSSM